MADERRPVVCMSYLCVTRNAFTISYVSRRRFFTRPVILLLAPRKKKKDWKARLQRQIYENNEKK